MESKGKEPMVITEWEARIITGIEAREARIIEKEPEIMKELVPSSL